MGFHVRVRIFQATHLIWRERIKRFARSLLELSCGLGAGCPIAHSVGQLTIRDFEQWHQVLDLSIVGEWNMLFAAFHIPANTGLSYQHECQPERNFPTAHAERQPVKELVSTWWGFRRCNALGGPCFLSGIQRLMQVQPFRNFAVS